MPSTDTPPGQLDAADVDELANLRAGLRRHLDAIGRAEYQLEELEAVDGLWTIADRLRRRLIIAASDAGYTGSEIAQAAGGVTKEAVNKMLRRARRAAP